MKMLCAIVPLLAASVLGQAPPPPSFDPDEYLRHQNASPTPVHLDFKPDKTPAEIARSVFPSVVLLTMQDAQGQPLSE